jgi:RNA polymerase-associated protein LEO1
VPHAAGWLLPLCRPASDSVVLLKVPNIVRVDPRPYDPNTFEEGEEAITDERTGITKIRPRDINVIRWRFK